MIVAADLSGVLVYANSAKYEENEKTDQTDGSITTGKTEPFLLSESLEHICRLIKYQPQA